MKHHLAFVLGLIVATFMVRGADRIPQPNRAPSNVGQEFYCSMPTLFSSSDADSVVFCIQSEQDGSLSIENIASGFSKSIRFSKNTRTLVALPAIQAEPITLAQNGSMPAESVLSQWAVHCLSSVPISLSCAVQFGNLTESFSCLPTESLGTKYICSSMPDMSWIHDGELNRPSEITIVAAYNNTSVTVTIGGPSATQTVGGLRAGQSKKFELSQGDVLILANPASAKEADLSGTIVQSSKPVAVFDGNQCANVPETILPCKYIAEQELPTQQWANQIPLPLSAERTYGYYMKVFASATNTSVDWNCTFYKMIQTVGLFPGTGWIYQRIDPSANNATLLTSDKAIHATVFNPGQGDDSISSGPFQMNALPWEQFVTYAAFCTPYPWPKKSTVKNYFGVVCAIDSLNRVPNNLELATVDSGGSLQWQSLSSIYGSGVLSTQIYPCALANGKRYGYKECRVGSSDVIAVRCPDPFMIYNYGHDDSTKSYGQPGVYLCKNMEMQEDTSSPQSTANFRLSPPGFSGHCSDFPDNDAIRSNMAKIVLDASSNNVKLSVVSSVIPAPRDLDWSLDVIDESKAYNATLYFVDLAGNSSQLVFAGSAPSSGRPHIATSDKLTVCVGDTVTLRCPNASTFQSITWSTAEHDSIIHLTSSTPQLLRVSISAITNAADTVSGDTLSVIFVQKPPTPGLLHSGDVLYTSTQATSYAWYRNDSLLVNETRDSLTLTQTGSYRVSVSNGICTTFSDSILVDHLLSAPDADVAGYTLIPNPAENWCTLYCSTEQPQYVDLFDERGISILRIVSDQRSANRILIPLQTVHAGAYVLRIHDAKGVHGLKLLKN